MSDKDLFRESIKGVQPITSNDKVIIRPQAKVSAKSLKIRREQAVLAAARQDKNYLSEDFITPIAPHAWLSYKRPGVQEGVFRKLRLGKYPIQARLDLHRKTVQEARALVWRFIHQSIAEDRRVVLITHGKGERQPEPAKLKSFTNHWLHQLAANGLVLAFHSAQPQHGGSGSAYVLLRKSVEKQQENRERFQS